MAEPHINEGWRNFHDLSHVGVPTPIEPKPTDTAEQALTPLDSSHTIQPQVDQFRQPPFDWSKDGPFEGTNLSACTTLEFAKAGINAWGIREFLRSYPNIPETQKIREALTTILEQNHRALSRLSIEMTAARPPEASI
jgi:hypothetical protein